MTSSASSIQSNFRPETTLSDCYLSPREKAILGCVLGALLIIAGIFIVLAANGILPHGVNAISRLGIGGRLIAGFCVGVGIFLLSTSIELYSKSKKREVINRLYPQWKAQIKQLLQLRLPQYKQLLLKELHQQMPALSENCKHEILQIFAKKWLSEADVILDQILHGIQKEGALEDVPLDVLSAIPQTFIQIVDGQIEKTAKETVQKIRASHQVG